MLVLEIVLDVESLMATRRVNIIFVFPGSNRFWQLSLQTISFTPGLIVHAFSQVQVMA
jgi:hypothetical protein